MGKILVVAEKPSVGKDIAAILNCKESHSGYMEGEKYVVTWAFGHLVGLKEPHEHNEKFKKWDKADLPFCFDVNESLKVLPASAGQFNIIKKLIQRNDIECIINAGDAGREGYLIQKWIYRMAGNRKPEKVLWADDATEKTIKKCMGALKDDRDFRNMLQEAEARAEGDYLIGINYTRALTLNLAGKGTVLSFGRCQTPLLNLIVKRDTEIVQFQPVPYFNIAVRIGKTENEELTAVLLAEDDKVQNFLNRAAAEDVIADLRQLSKGTIIQCVTEEKSEKAPLLHDLSSLQQRMGAKYKYPPDKTLEICQALYEKYKILSYPRTDSKYLTTSLYDEITEHIKSCNFGKFAEWTDKIDFGMIKPDKSYFNDHKVTDHHALIPTINPDMETIYEKLSDEERNVFDEVAVRLLQIFLPEYKYRTTKIRFKTDGQQYIFGATGNMVVQLGYKEAGQMLLNDKVKADDEIPLVEEGEAYEIAEAQILDKKTQPPKAYTVSSIIRDMEKYSIGTPATRAEIIKKLMAANRQYVTLQNGKYHSTNIGRAYIKMIPARLKEIEFTQKFEKELQEVGEGKKTKGEFLNNLLEQTRADLAYFQELAKENKDKGAGEVLQRDGVDEVYGQCPHCKADVKKGKYGFYCTGKCGMNLNSFYGRAYTENQLKKLLNGKKILMKDLVGKNGTYDAYFIPTGVEEYEYNGKKGYQFTFEREFKTKK